MLGLALRRLGFVAFLIGAVAISLVFMSPRAGAAEGTVHIGSAGAGIGQDVGVALAALDVGSPGLGAWTIDVAYDPTVLTIEACQPKQGGICNASFGPGVLRVAGISVGGLAGSSDLAHITFHCASIGISELAVNVDIFSDASLGAPQPISVVVQDGAVSCSESPPPATPTTLPTEGPEPTAAPPRSEPDKLPGDADCDGDVDAIDAAFLLQFEAQLVDELACAENADVNHDGVAGPIDAALILQTSAGLLG